MTLVGILVLPACASVELTAEPPSSSAGIELSRAQGVFNWPTLQGRGLAFAYVAATEGGDIVDLTFSRNWTEAEKAGMKRGALHRFQICRAPEEQAEWFKAHVPQDQNALPAAVAIDWDLKTPLCHGTPSASSIVADLNLFLYELERHYGKRPIIRTSMPFRRDVLAGNFSGYDYWLSDPQPGADAGWTLRVLPDAIGLEGAQRPAPRIIASRRLIEGDFARLAGL